MEPFYFESESGSLLGIYYPSADLVSRKSVVICPPIYQEYARTYRVLSRLAERWAGKGYHVLRFDYYGTGDSAGDLSEGGPVKWCADIRSAVSELTEISGSDRVSLFGIRHGATMALKVQADIEAVKSVVVWDPILGGSDYLENLRNSHCEFVDSLPELTKQEKGSAKTELSGFGHCDWHEDELQKIRLTAPDLIGIDHLSAVSSREECPELAEFLDQCLSNRINVESKCIEADCNWHSPSGAMLQVPDLIEGVASCLK